MPSTPRWALPYPASTDPPAGFTEIQALATALDSVAMDDQGILANRPVSTAPNPGKKGRYYYVIGDSTAANNGILWRDHGTGWDIVSATGTIIDTRANRPAANAVLIGQRFFATDQVVEWMSDGANWLRLSGAVGDMVETLNTTAEPGRVLLQGQDISRVGIYADLFAKWGTAYGAGDGTTTFTLPDRRGRVPVVKGTNGDVNAIGANDGLPVGSRSPIHNSTVNDLISKNIVLTTGSGSPTDAATGATAGHFGAVASPGVSVGPGGTRPIDTPAFFVVNVEAKL